MQQTPTPTTERERVHAFVELGFDATQSLVLAATQGSGEHVQVGLVKRLLDAGCTHELALRIVI